MNLFVYGTLLIPRVLEAVAGRSFERRDAVLMNYARYSLVGVTYPGLVPAPGARTPGALILDVDSQSLSRLDAFEGDEYERISVTVDSRPAITYLLRAAYRHRLTGTDWDLDHFVAHNLCRFLGED